VQEKASMRGPLMRPVRQMRRDDGVGAAEL
jgi:hypothetical protein